MNDKIEKLIGDFSDLKYVLHEDLATTVYLMEQLEKPLLLEGNPGVGKTEIAYVLAKYYDTEIIRLQCYEGLDVNSSIYEWNYQKQLLSIKASEANGSTIDVRDIFGREYLLERPLLKAISNQAKRPILLIDEIDRADEEFEAFLLELLSVFQISIPELGTIKAKYKPIIILTSNRTRDLGDALRRRCLYHWIDYPDVEKEKEIVRKHIPDMEEKVAESIVNMVNHIRGLKLSKTPGIAETIEWANAIVALGEGAIDKDILKNTLSAILKSAQDIAKVQREEELNALVEYA
jgi:MoxR-like ATPase